MNVGLAQIAAEPYAVAENRQRTLEVAGQLFDRGAQIVVLPELVVPGYVADRERLLPVAEPIDGPTVSEWVELAAARDGYICGGFCERVGDDLFNSAVVVGEGGVLLHYRKLHLFRTEKLALTPGDLGLPVAELPFGTVGMCVCYDLRFVETVRVLALEGAELICVPTAWVAGFDSIQWDDRGLAPQAEGAILQANLDQAFIACASQVGSSEDFEFLGSSILAGPTGGIVAGPLPGREEQLSVSEIDLDDVERAQKRDELITPRADRRRDVYSISAGGDPL